MTTVDLVDLCRRCCLERTVQSRLHFGLWLVVEEAAAVTTSDKTGNQAVNQLSNQARDRVSNHASKFYVSNPRNYL